MNFFRKKRRHEDEGETSEQPPAKKATRTTRLLAWIKEKFKKSGSQDQETPAHRRTVRYVMTPQEAFSPSAVASDVRSQQCYELNSVVDVTESKNYEFKAAGGRYPTQVLPEHIRKYGSAFLNSSGGVLLAGILDDGVVQGVSYCSSSYKRLILSTIKREFEYFRPRVDHRKYSVNFVPVSFPQNYHDRSLGRRAFVPDTYVIEVAIRQGDPGELYEDGCHKVYVRREGSVEGPLSPVKIKDLVLQNMKEVLQEKKRKRSDDHHDSTPKEIENKVSTNSGCEEEAGSDTPQQPIKKRVKISPIVFDLKDTDRA